MGKPHYGSEPCTPEQLRSTIRELVRQYHSVAFPERVFLPGGGRVPVSGRVFDSEDIEYLVDSALDFWLTTGRYAKQFESEFSRFMQVRCASLVNSGSSANLLALTCLTSPKLGERRLVPGDEVLTVAAGFPTTVNPILQNRLLPVFVDVDPRTYNAKTCELEAAIGPRTRAIMLAHTLGNAFEVDRVRELCDQHGLYLIEDCCDAVGSTYKGRLLGTWGDVATVSFYPAHHITMGEGGCVLTPSPRLQKLIESFRDWGRECWCDPGQDGTCGRRFEWQLDDGCSYDHKYVYSHIGYNLKVTDMQAAVGCAQLKKLPRFIEARKRNFAHLAAGLASCADRLLLPEAAPGSDPSWFGFPISVRSDAGFTRDELTRHLEAQGIATRLLFGGNLTKQPAYRESQYRVASPLTNTDFVARSSFWIGVHPGLSTAMLDFMVDRITRYVRSR